MSSYYELIDFLPQIPDELLITDVAELYKRNNAFSSDRTYDYWYFTTLVDEPIYNLIQPCFDYPVDIYYQLSGVQLTPHIDKGRYECFNYTILPGGPDVKTRWYLDDELVFQVTAPIKTWHKIRVDVTHDISPIDSHRLSLSVQRK